jgi:hypothetical protein
LGPATSSTTGFFWFIGVICRHRRK